MIIGGVPMLFSGAAPYNPLSLFASGEQGLWYDPSDFSTMFQDSAGTVPVTAADQPVGRLLDKSGQGNHATQSTAAKRPTLKIDGAGKYYLLFDGVDDALATTSVNFSASDKLTTWVGIRKLTDSVGIPLELSANSALNAGSFIFVSGIDGGFSWYVVSTGSRGLSGDQVSGATVAAPDTAVISSTNDIAGDSTVFRRNKVASVAGAGDKGTGNFGNYPIYIGARAETIAPLSGHIYGIIMRGAASSEAELIAAEDYLNGKTGAY